MGGKPRNSLTGINIKTYTNKYRVLLSNRPSEKDWVLADQKSSMAAKSERSVGLC